MTPIRHMTRELSMISLVNHCTTPLILTKIPLQVALPGCEYHKDGCDIKGNISFDTAEKIYHVPGQQYYATTTIDPNYGERWFCTEGQKQKPMAGEGPTNNKAARHMKRDTELAQLLLLFVREGCRLYVYCILLAR